MASYRLAEIARLAKADAFAGLFDSTTFTIEIYEGAQPATVDDADTGDLLATFTGPTAPGFGDAADGGTAAVVTAGVIATVTASDTGTAGHFRLKQSTTIVADGDVGVAGSGATCILSSLSLVSGQPVSITAFTHTEPSGA